jgi:hypothetical protein
MLIRDFAFRLVALTTMVFSACSFLKSHPEPGVSMLDNYPEKGWKMYSSARNFGDPGSLVGVDSQGIESEIRTLKATLTPREEEDPDYALSQTEKVGLGLISDWVVRGSPINLALDVANRKSGTVSIKIQGASRLVLNDDQIKELFLLFDKAPEENLFRYKQYYIVRSTLRARKIAFKLDESTIRNLGGKFKISQAIDGIAGYSWDERREFQLERTFAQPMNIFFKPAYYNPHEIWLRKQREDRDRIQRESNERTRDSLVKVEAENRKHIEDEAARKRDVTIPILEPDVKSSETPLKHIVFRRGEHVNFSAGGCVQTGGSGKTWKRYVNPIPTDRYYGYIKIPGVLDEVTPLRSLTSPVAIPESLKETYLIIGYKDDKYEDNGYQDRNDDDGTDAQCKDLGNAWIKVQIKYP